MRFEYLSVATGAVLDVVTGDSPGGLTYETGRAAGTVAMLLRRGGPDRLMAALGDWSNGYVQLRAA